MIACYEISMALNYQNEGSKTLRANSFTPNFLVWKLKSVKTVWLTLITSCYKKLIDSLKKLLG